MIEHGYRDVVGRAVLGCHPRHILRVDRLDFDTKPAKVTSFELACPPPQRELMLTRGGAESQLGGYLRADSALGWLYESVYRSK